MRFFTSISQLDANEQSATSLPHFSCDATRFSCVFISRTLWTHRQPLPSSLDWLIGILPSLSLRGHGQSLVPAAGREGASEVGGVTVSSHNGGWWRFGSGAGDVGLNCCCGPQPQHHQHFILVSLTLTSTHSPPSPDLSQ